MREFHITTNDWAVVKFRYVKQTMRWKGEVFHASIGRTAQEAWNNAVNSSKISKREFIASGWKAQRLIITGHQ